MSAEGTYARLDDDPPTGGEGAEDGEDACPVRALSDGTAAERVRQRASHAPCNGGWDQPALSFLWHTVDPLHPHADACACPALSTRLK